MTVEVATYIASLNSANPPGSDGVVEGDNHLRLIKSVLLSSFPNMDGPFYRPKQVTKTANYTLTIADDNQTIILDSATAFTITLPPTSGGSAISAGWSCKLFTKQSPSSAHTISRNATPGTDTINGAASITPFLFIGDASEVHYIGSGVFVLIGHSFNRHTMRFTDANDITGVRWGELVYSASTHSVPATNIGIASALLGSNYYFRSKDNAGTQRYLRRPTVTVFTSSGTWTKPTGCTAVDVIVVGGGGAGGGAAATAAGQSSGGGSGGGGEVAYKWGLTGAGSTETITVGAAGAGVSGGNGGNGGNSSFGGFVSANGGSGGSALAAGTGLGFSNGGGLGGTGGTGGDLHIPGEPGGKVVRNVATSCEVDNGGGCAFGVGGRGWASGVAGTAALGRGGGGAGETNGASSGAQTGNAGTAGLVIVVEYYN